ncbi:MAG: alanine racemase, partial [Planctomycetes bacterium]|nr:alanine racemase [Planctomycetota bacterium]
REIDIINELSAKVSLELIVDSQFSANFLSEKIINNVNIWIEINAGYNRSGVISDDISEVVRIAEVLQNSPKLKLKGILSHFGNTYSAKSRYEIQTIYTESLNRVQKVRKILISIFGAEFLISVGDSPSCSILEDLGQIDEIRPGNFVFYDFMQISLGTCAETDIAVALACPVISKNSGQNELVLYGGAIHLSKEYIIYKKQKCFGAIVIISENGWGKIIDDAYIKSISQEHAIVHASKNTLQSFEIGDLVGVLPVHSCLTANLMGKYLSTDGRIIEIAQFR